MKILVWVTLIIPISIMLAGAQPDEKTSTAPIIRQGLSASVQGTDMAGYVSETDFEQILNNAEDEFKKLKPTANKTYIEIAIGMLSKKVQEDIKFSDYVRTHTDQSIKLLDKDIELNKEDITAYNWRADAYREKCSGYNPGYKTHAGNKIFCENAIKDFEKVAAMSTEKTQGPGYTPIKPEAYRQQGMLYEKLGDREKALNAYTLGLKFVKPGFENFLCQNRSSLLIEMGRYEDAARDLKTFLNAHVEKYSKMRLAFSPCKRLAEQGYFVDGCPDKEILKKNDYMSYGKIVSEEMRKHDEETKKQQGGK